MSVRVFWRVLSFAPLPASITCSLIVQGQWIIVPLCISPIFLPLITQSAVLYGSTMDYYPLQLTCLLSPHPSPNQLHTYSRGTPMWILHPLVLLQPQLFCFLVSYTKVEVHVDTYKHIHSQTEGVFSIRFKCTVFTLADPSGSTSYIVNPPILFSRENSGARACMITSHTFSTFRPHLCGLSVCEK